ncbi:hypothetical protein DSL92_09000 [Billgrantia gudaonensis]|uniref:Uncharacterized protein n=1 Tax=Billgrantia gudaonensis TaxID=376427 RepID=A0A3S0NWF8_9GAMM|nr:hypothetical protein DSL92_09000 [Halomonas gudaonensis]
MPPNATTRCSTCAMAVKPISTRSGQATPGRHASRHCQEYDTTSLESPPLVRYDGLLGETIRKAWHSSVSTVS